MKTVLVTGAGRGIGAAIAKAIARDGYRVAVHYRNAKEQAEGVASEIRAAGGEAECFAADLSVPAEADDLVKRVEATGAIYGLVCNAGVMFSKPISFTGIQDWRQVMATNLDAPFLLTKAVSRAFVRRREGRIVYISSDAALMGDLMRSAYSASKAGLIGLCRTANRELAPSGITVNSVAPGIIETDMTADMPESRRRKELEWIPFGRFGKPEEVASVVRFLLSADAAYITGQTISVDGGLQTAR
ncbi:MAG: 3-oxoacyl-ACP reductase FabG [Kiritimatiellae bacterium]|nr:3-oxoacyl-ACP reductase FabG [Kiritimatiellia bacterium]